MHASYFSALLHTQKSRNRGLEKKSPWAMFHKNCEEMGRRLFHYGGAGVGSIYCSFALTHASPQEVEVPLNLDVALFLPSDVTG
jgi:hypothetical protein